MEPTQYITMDADETEEIIPGSISEGENEIRAIEGENEIQALEFHEGINLDSTHQYANNSTQLFQEVDLEGKNIIIKKTKFI